MSAFGGKADMSGRLCCDARSLTCYTCDECEREDRYSSIVLLPLNVRSHVGQRRSSSRRLDAIVSRNYSGSLRLRAQRRPKNLAGALC